MMRYFLWISSILMAFSLGFSLYSYYEYNSKLDYERDIKNNISSVDNKISSIKDEISKKDEEINNIKEEKKDLMEEYELWESYKNQIESN